MAIDFFVNDDDMQTLIDGVKKAKENMTEITNSICNLQNEILSSDSWKGNGKDECAVFLGIIAKFMGLICGENVSVSGNSSSALSGKSVVGSDTNMEKLIDALTEYRKKFMQFEKGASPKADCIGELDSIQ